MKFFVILFVSLFSTSCLFGQASDAMAGLIKFSIDEFCQNDSLLSVKHSHSKLSKYKYISTEGLPRKFISSKLDDNYVLVYNNYNSVKNACKLEKSKAVFPMCVSVSFEQDMFVVDIRKVGMSCARYRLHKIVNISSSDDGREYQFKFNPMENKWMLFRPPFDWIDKRGHYCEPLW